MQNGKLIVFIISIFTLIYCEFLNYFLVISQCSWPNFPNETSIRGDNMVKALFLTDTHLLGPYRGHWFDKLRREWQMYRAFQTAISLHQPEVVFILGDLFDEGQWCNEAQFEEYVSRFFSLFDTPATTDLYVVPGNHDIGFHYAIRPYLVNRFDKTFNFTGVQLLNLKQNSIILINSMALEGDNCRFCLNAEKKLKEIAAELRCVKENKVCELTKKVKDYSRPIVLQHFPMYRKSDAVCHEIDEAPAHLKHTPFREKWDCLSRSASEMVFWKHYLQNEPQFPEPIHFYPFLIFPLSELNPRLIITGHVHHGCHIVHKKDIHEYTLSSFSWRNKNNPTFMLVKFTPDNFIVKKCDVPKESTVILTYTVVLIGTIIFTAFKVKKYIGTIIFSAFKGKKHIKLKHKT